MNKQIPITIAILIILIVSGAIGAIVFYYSQNINSTVNNQDYQSLFINRNVAIDEKEEDDLNKIKEEDFLIAAIAREIEVEIKNKCDLGRFLLGDMDEYMFYGTIPWVEEDGNINLINGYSLYPISKTKSPEIGDCFTKTISNYLISNGFIVNKKNTREEWSFYGLEKDSMRVLVDGLWILFSLGNIENKTDLGEITIDDYNEIHALFSDEEDKPLIGIWIESSMNDFVRGGVSARIGSNGFIVKKNNGKWEFLTSFGGWYADCEIVIKENIPPVLVDFHCWSESDESIMKYSEENNSWESIMQEDGEG